MITTYALTTQGTIGGQLQAVLGFVQANPHNPHAIQMALEPARTALEQLDGAPILFPIGEFAGSQPSSEDWSCYHRGLAPELANEVRPPLSLKLLKIAGSLEPLAKAKEEAAWNPGLLAQAAAAGVISAEAHQELLPNVSK
ncbi:MAG: hypothetical protein HY540_00765 [Deltaproteobacteria bacterium]|nr:hypothetical protein [Deltaproteobacteria bacterium]